MGNSYLPNSLNLNNITNCAVDIYIYIYIQSLTLQNPYMKYNKVAF